VAASEGSEKARQLADKTDFCMASDIYPISDVFSRVSYIPVIRCAG